MIDRYGDKNNKKKEKIKILKNNKNTNREREGAWVFETKNPTRTIRVFPRSLAADNNGASLNSFLCDYLTLSFAIRFWFTSKTWSVLHTQFWFSNFWMNYLVRKFDFSITFAETKYLSR